MTKTKQNKYEKTDIIIVCPCHDGNDIHKL